MVDLQILREKHGLTQEALQGWLSSITMFDGGLAGTGNKDNAEALRGQMRNRHRSRIQEGQNRNLSEGKIYYALDQAWDTPFRQITPTLVQSLMDKDPADEEVHRIVSSWGLAYLIEEIKDPKSGKPVKRLNLPIFFNVFVPLVKAYVTIRWAKIVNDRRLSPFLKYEPAKSTAISRLKCEAITDRVQVMSEQYGYFEVMKQAVLKMLHYSQCMQFPIEEWDIEEQERVATAQDIAEMALPTETEDETPRPAVGDPIKVITREGIRYNHPHPSRCFRDLAHPAHTYNTDTGCEYGGYWRILRYRELLGKSFWNTDRISIGATDLIGDNKVFFTTVYPCNMAFPVNGKGTAVAISPATPSGSSLAMEAGANVGELDREKKMANQFYTTDIGDQAVMVTELFEKLVPSENGLGTYDCPVWFRFVLAGDQATYLYAAPLPSCPIVYYGYDEDGNRSMNASMTLEVLPFQDQFGNLLSQLLLGVKQNLANLVLIDQDQVDETVIGRIQNLGEKFFRFLNVQPFQARKAVHAQNRPIEAVQSFKFPQMNTAEIISCMRVILDTLERVLVMSAQEVGQAASHEQTREEIRNIAQSSSSRQTFTCIPVDIAREAWKRQIYSYLMAYGSADFETHVPAEQPLPKEVMEALGFTFADDDEHRHSKDRHIRIKTTLRHSAMDLYEFANTNDGEDRKDDAKLAMTMATLIKDLLANPITAPAIGAEQAIAWANQIGYLAGLPKDYQLHALPSASPEQQQQAAQQQLQQVVQAVLQQVTPMIAKGIEPLMEAVKEQGSEIGAIMRVLQIAPPHPADDTLHQATPTVPPIQGNP